jgi:putative intracellular protease/amidase
MKGKILIVLTNNDRLGDTGKQTGWYLPEVAHPYEVFTKNGFLVDFVTPKGGPAPVDQGSVKDWSHDKVSLDFYNDESIGRKLQNTLKPSEVKIEEYDAIFYAGGHGPLWDVTENGEIAKLSGDLYEKHNGVVAAVCHGPTGLLNIKTSGNNEYLLKGKKATAFSNVEEEIVNLHNVVPFALEDEMKERGAIYQKAEKPWEPCVVVDGRLVTGQNPASAYGVAEAIVKLLKN